MTSLVVRRLLIDLETPFERHWNGGDAFRTAFFNALSMSFPVGEQFFIDAVRAGLAALPPAQRERFAAEAQGFVGQEATHRRIHALFNRQLQAQGYENRWQERAQRRIERIRPLQPRHHVAATAALEHFTALLAHHLLAHPGQIEGADSRLRTLWEWHAAEESEHRCTAFDLYRALGGDERRRRRWFLIVSLHFVTDLLRQTVLNLRHDRALWKRRTWASALRFLFGRGGLVRENFGAWRAYLRPGFHPSQQDASAALLWLQRHAEAYAVVVAPR
jgi:predicted metal-dependent hydrolase